MLLLSSYRCLHMYTYTPFYYTSSTRALHTFSIVEFLPARFCPHRVSVVEQANFAEKRRKTNSRLILRAQDPVRMC